ncbi:MAG: TatD family hydrolase [Saprospirales bacterium]|nr:TatD family hydrolase [Saprospirales bacterium]
MWTDTHTHLYLGQFDEDRSQVVERALAAGVSSMYLPNVDSRTIDSMLSLEREFPDQVFAMMGLHPCSVKDNYREELKVVESWLGRRDFCAIGEIGTDLHWDKTRLEEQKEAFLTQVRWAKELGKPVVIHCRESVDITLELLQAEKGPQLRGIFHCFTGTPEQARAVMDLGFLMGIGGVLTFKNSGLDKVLESVPLEYLVLETDSPYLAPVPYRGKRNESAYIPLVGARLSDLKGISMEELARITTENAKSLFGHPTK